MKINFYDELVEALHNNDKTLWDVTWVGTKEIVFNWNEFILWAKSFNYDNGYGMNCIPLSWVIVGDNWWLERYEYGGAEWWEYKELPKRPSRFTNDFLNVDEEDGNV